MNIKDLFKKKRYFIVFYQGKLNDYQTSTGNVSTWTDDYYFNQKKLTDKISEVNNLQSCVLTNIIELSKKEFDIFYHNE